MSTPLRLNPEHVLIELNRVMPQARWYLQGQGEDRDRFVMRGIMNPTSPPRSVQNTVRLYWTQDARFEGVTIEGFFDWYDTLDHNAVLDLTPTRVALWAKDFLDKQAAYLAQTAADMTAALASGVTP